MMKNKNRLTILLMLSTIITGSLYFMTYIFNAKFNSNRNILYVRDYRNEGGLILIMLLLSLLLIFTLMFIRYVRKDTKSLEIYKQSGIPEYYKKDNIFTLYRLFQYYTVGTTLFVLIRDGYRAYTYAESMMAMYLFKTDILFVMWDTSVWLFLGMTITLLIEFFNQKETIES